MSTRAGYAGASDAPGPARERSAAPPRLAPRPRAAAAPGAPGAAPPDAPARSRSSTVPTNKQRRRLPSATCRSSWSAAPSWPSKRRRNLGILATVVAVAVVVVAALVITGVFSGDDDEQRRGRQLVVGRHRQRRGRHHERRRHDLLHLQPDDSGNPNLKDVGTPPTPETTPTTGTATLLDEHQPGRPDADPRPDEGPLRRRRASPTWRQQKFFDGSPCHREVNQPTFGVLQCGDPTGTGSGGPTLQVRPGDPGGDDLPARHDRHGQHRPGQLDRQPVLPRASPTPSSARTTPPVGTVDEAGLDVLDKIAAAGNDGSFEPRPAAAPRTCRSRSTR